MLTPTDIASICHEANRRLQIIQADPGISVAPPWDEISEEMRESIVSGVLGVLAGNTPEKSHQGWCDFKTERGWVYGPVKDEDAKTHPCLVSYADLPAEQKIKDALFGGIVRALVS